MDSRGSGSGAKGIWGGKREISDLLRPLRGGRRGGGRGKGKESRRNGRKIRREKP